jgi:hypothetical protein
MNPKLEYTLTDGSAIAEIACFNLPQTSKNSGMGDFIPQVR